MLGNVMTVKSGVMKSGKALVDGNECILKLTPELLMYESPVMQGSILLRSIKVLGVHSDELVLDYQKNQYELGRITIKPSSDITLHRKKMEFDNRSQKYLVVGEDGAHIVSGGLYSWLLEWYSTLGCGLGDVLGFNVWDEDADHANQRGVKPRKAMWVSPISFLYDQVTIQNENYLFNKIYEVWKLEVEMAAKRASVANPIEPKTIVNFSEDPDFYRNQNVAAILEKKHGLGIDGWSNLDMINIGNYSPAVQKDWAQINYIQFMLRWINYRSGHAYTSEFGMWPDEYEKFFLKTGVVISPFLIQVERDRSRMKPENVELAPIWKREYDEKTVKTFKEWFLR